MTNTKTKERESQVDLCPGLWNVQVKERGVWHTKVVELEYLDAEFQLYDYVIDAYPGKEIRIRKPK